MKRNSMLVLGFAALAACAPPQTHLSTATYTSDATDGPLANARLAVDLGANSGTLTLADAQIVTLTLAAVDRANWVELCPTNAGATIAQTFTVTPDPLIAGTLQLGAPQLSSGCANHLALLIGIDAADGQEKQLTFVAPAGTGGGDDGDDGYGRY
jgi:hypothetical protein